MVIYVEGGGYHNRGLQRICREAFHKFFEKAGFSGRLPRTVLSGGRSQAYEDFKNACASGDSALLLIDSEDAVRCVSPWEHCLSRDKFLKPVNATDEHCHFMVVCMETWLLADKDALSGYFGNGFNANALPVNSNLENVAKSDIFAALENATKKCKSSYKKGAISFNILAKISPDKVKSTSTWAARFFEQLDRDL